MTGPPEPNWDEAGFPELAEEARSQAQSKRYEAITKEFKRRKRIKAGELEDQQKRIDNAANAGKLITKITGAGLIVLGGGMAIIAVESSPVAYAAGSNLMNSGVAVFGGSFFYGLASPPGSPDIPFVPGDDLGRGARQLLSTGGAAGRQVTAEIERHVWNLTQALRNIGRQQLPGISRLATGALNRIMRSLQGSVTPDAIDQLVYEARIIVDTGGDLGNEGRAAYNALLKFFELKD